MSSYFKSIFQLSTKDLSKPALYYKDQILTYEHLLHLISKEAEHISKLNLSGRIGFMGHINLETIVYIFASLECGLSPCIVNFRVSEQLFLHYMNLAKVNGYLLNESLTKLTDTPAPSRLIHLFTSGSSSLPKLVTLTPKNLLASAQSCIQQLSLSQSSCWQASLPFFHVSGLAILFRTFLVKSSICFEMSSLVSHLSFVPTQLYRFLQNRVTLPHLTSILVGGAPLNKDLFSKAIGYHLPLQLTYGMTEMGSMIALGRTSEFCLGPPLPGVQLKIEHQEICVQGPSLFAGYNFLPPPLDSEGFFKTNDLGSLDTEGNLSVFGRKDLMFISGGENIHPEEIEKSLCNFPGIIEAIVIPKEDPEFGQRPIAFLLTEENELPSPKLLLSFLRQHIRAEALPTRFYPFPKELLDEGIKCSRKKLASQAAFFFSHG